ncbi:hypothetical protein LPJ61_003648 [Coemansia biformis]|uniref:Uncharacterized protein n=1 Tax=Coemansia biformis TaxID=1286918 RepID=A0A9W7YCM1_9FUNG|nr:hypothetical protein LPJ61_003648 [Coemansia biformis]
MYICRDVWGIASDALHLLRRLTQYPVVRGMLATPGLVESLGGIVPGIVDGSGAPQLIRNLTRTQTVLSFADLMDDAEDEPDLLPFPLFGIDESGEVGSDKSSQETDVIAAAIDLEDDNDGAGSENEDVVDKLLFESAQLRRPRQRQRALGDYYSVGILTPLWRTFVDELLELPAFIAFGPTPVNTPGEAEVLERLADRDNVLFDLLRPLLAARGSLAGTNTLWNEVTIEMAVRILELAIYYDVRPVIVCLAWYVCSNVGKDGVTLSNDDLDRLAVMYSEGWGQYLPTTDAKRAVNRMLAAILLLHLDTVDVVGAVGPDIEPFSAVATRLFQNPIDPRACR